MEAQINLDPENQKHWAVIVERSIYNKTNAAKVYKINPGQLSLYLRGEVNPQLKQLQKVIDMMKDLMKKPAPIKHPSFGFATESEIEKLNKMGLCPEREKILADIAKRAKTKGKVRP